MTASRPSWSIGLDIGGTYADMVASDASGRLHALKWPMQGAGGGLAAAVLDGLRSLMRAHDLKAEAIRRVVHGTTVVTNHLLQAPPCPVAVLTTRGFRDVLVLGRQHRRDLYAAAVPAGAAARVFPSEWRREVAGRLAADGTEVEALDEASARALLRELRQQGVRAVAVCLLHADRHPGHEQRLAQWIDDELPDVPVSLSHKVDPAPQEAERMLATALDAYARPVVADYLRALTSGLIAMGLPEPWLVRSDGSALLAADAGGQALQLALSGPAAAMNGFRNLVVDSSRSQASGLTAVTLEIGGTSSDIGLIHAGQTVLRQDVSLGAWAWRMPCADIASEPVGGGSVVRVLEGGALRLGPQSQGADPGPAAYGLDGREATLTDALVLLDRLPHQLAGGRALDAAAAASAFAPVARALGLSLQGAARAVVATAATAIAQAIKTHTYSRAIDPARVLVLAGGGGGGQHAAEVADQIGASQVHVVAQAGVVAAMGLLASDRVRTRRAALRHPLTGVGMASVGKLVQDWSGQAVVSLDQGAACAPAFEAAHGRWTLDVMYAGQGTGLELPFDPARDDAAALAERFEAVYRSQRGQVHEGACVITAVAWHLLEEGASWPPRGLAATEQLSASAWGDLAPQGTGPRALFARDTTVWVPAGWRWECVADAYGGHVLLNREVRHE